MNSTTLATFYATFTINLFQRLHKFSHSQ